VPVAVTEKVAVCPAVTSALTGCVVIEGDEDAPLTLALLLGPPPLLASATHPERERLPNRTTRRKSPYF
jgi:hypothetical protein